MAADIDMMMNSRSATELDVPAAGKSSVSSPHAEEASKHFHEKPLAMGSPHFYSIHAELR